jgi:hypothetical protein
MNFSAMVHSKLLQLITAHALCDSNRMKAVKDDADVFEWFATLRTVGHRKKPDTSGQRWKRRRKENGKMQPTI